MRLGRVVALFLLLITASAPGVYAQDSDTVPVEVQGHPEQAAQDHVPGPVHEEGGGSMPQLDPTYYASQLFWLLVSGVLLYTLMAKVALPRVARIIEIRDDQVRRDLELAARLRHEAEDIKVAYTRALRDSDERARALSERTVNDIRDKQAKALEASTVSINKQISDTEQNLRLEKELALKEVPAMADKLSATIIREFKEKAA
jgi:F-type H+-transporting ATPase subunit b